MGKPVVPHSWAIESWPDSVFPGGPSKARYLVRRHHDELLRYGCLSRVGRTLVVLGARYQKWLELHSSSVPGYQIAANRKPSQTATAAA
jgi:hypothetical protein